MSTPPKTNSNLISRSSPPPPASATTDPTPPLTSSPSPLSSPSYPFTSQGITSSPLSSSPPKAPALSPRDSSSSTSSGATATATAAVRVSSPLNPNANTSPRLPGLNFTFPSLNASQQSSPTRTSPTSSNSSEEVFRSRGISASSLKKPPTTSSRGISPARGRPTTAHSSPGPIVHSFSSPAGGTRSLPPSGTSHSSPGANVAHLQPDSASTPTLTVSSPTGLHHEEGRRSQISLPDDLSTLSGEVLMSSFSRSRSHSREGRGSRDTSPSRSVDSPRGGILGRKRAGTDTPPYAPPRSWWGLHSSDSEEKEKEKGGVVSGVKKTKVKLSKEEEDVRVAVRKRVLQATISTLGTMKDLTHEALELGVDFLELAPIPGLQSVGRLVLSVWDAVEEVDMNRLASLRLAERCADILLSVRLEVKEAGDVVGEELKAPLGRLEESFKQVLEFLQRNNRRPLLKRYLKRDEILREIAGLDGNLRDALGMFGLSVQIRILKQVQESERQRQQDTHAILEHLLKHQHGSGDSVQPRMLLPPNEEDEDNALGLALDSPQERLDMLEWDHPANTPLPTPSFPMPLIPGGHVPEHELALPTPPPLVSPHQLSPEEISQALHAYHAQQNTADAERDMENLREFLRLILQGSDVDVVDAMGIGRGEMVEAVKTLQRALEKEREREREEEKELEEKEKEREREEKEREKEKDKGGVPGLVRRMSLPRRGSKTDESASSGSSGSLKRGAVKEGRRDTLDREFMETSIDALRRLSRGAGMDTGDLPGWTITRYEVDRDLKIGMGFFSDVYRGTWRGKTVAIKVLDASAPRDLFKREVEIWKPLKHPNVLELFGASSTAGDPPWFFVSPYLKNGSLVEYLRRVEAEMGGAASPGGLTPPLHSGGSGRGRQATFPVWSMQTGPPTGRRGGSPGTRTRTISGNGILGMEGDVPVQREWDLWRFMHEIAKGMQYLHSYGVLHGDLKAANVLVDDKPRCVISDFGQSEIKNEAYRLSGKGKPHGTLRWQAPELMSGNTRLTAEMDVYAYAIACAEVLTMGKMPWLLSDDEAVRRFVLVDNARPAIPATRFYSPPVQDLLRRCWARDPKDRPPFAVIVQELKAIRKTAGVNVEAEVASPRLPGLQELVEEDHASPDMRPGPLPPISDMEEHWVGGPPARAHSEDIVSSDDKPGVPVPAVYTSSNESSRASTIDGLPESPVSAGAADHHPPLQRWQSPVVTDERMAMQRNERRYRLLLEHPFHQSLTLPLWSPSSVELGAVGYLRKPEGAFVTLFNAFSPHAATHPDVRSLPSVYGYGHVKKGSQKVDRRTFTQKGADKISGWLTFKNKGDVTSHNVARRVSFPLKAGHKVAVLYTELTDYRYVESLEAPKRWFKAHVEPVMQIFGSLHQIQREDLFLVIGTLQTPNYALFVSHSHPDGHAHFNVFSSPRRDQPWGSFTTDSLMQEEEGPSYADRADATRICASKISHNEGHWDSVLLARLRFKPDTLEPTSL